MGADKTATYAMVDIGQTMFAYTVFLAALKSAGVMPDDVELLDFAQNGGALTIDLSDAYASYIQSLGTSGEYIAVGCLVNTYLTAFGADTVSITVNGAPLESGHNVYDMPLEFYTDSTNS